MTLNKNFFLLVLMLLGTSVLAKGAKRSASKKITPTASAPDASASEKTSSDPTCDVRAGEISVGMQGFGQGFWVDRDGKQFSQPSTDVETTINNLWSLVGAKLCRSGVEVLPCSIGSGEIGVGAFGNTALGFWVTRSGAPFSQYALSAEDALAELNKLKSAGFCR